MLQLTTVLHWLPETGDPETLYPIMEKTINRHAGFQGANVKAGRAPLMYSDEYPNPHDPEFRLGLHAVSGSRL